MRIVTMECRICGEEMEYDVIEIALESHETVGQPGWYCWVCNLSGHSAQDLFLADHDAADKKPVKPATGRGS